MVLEKWFVHCNDKESSNNEHTGWFSCTFRDFAPGGNPKSLINYVLYLIDINFSECLPCKLQEWFPLDIKILYYMPMVFFCADVWQITLFLTSVLVRCIDSSTVTHYRHFNAGTKNTDRTTTHIFWSLSMFMSHEIWYWFALDALFPKSIIGWLTITISNGILKGKS